ncbi:fluoride efflux transporter CrcB [Cryobacterium sp. TMT2-17-1]|nr:fluoride efflux transporter CrcB [Cryobacterium sp. TMT2-14]TFC47306.1 fluoride efflux transporter CrcB [Cryobacterium sp. TMT2-17-1]TFC65237.1 fluoride efflux transporter CrcB [Cryobacterium sp. TMT2-4]
MDPPGPVGLGQGRPRHGGARVVHDLLRRHGVPGRARRGRIPDSRLDLPGGHSADGVRGRGPRPAAGGAASTPRVAGHSGCREHSVSTWLVLGVLVTGGAAAVIRYFVSRALPVGPGRLPLGVLIVNVAGSLIGGVVLGLSERAAVSADVQLILLTGVCGGLTTFSTWSVETVELTLTGRRRAGIVNLIGTLLLGFLVCGAGYLLSR